MYDNVGSTLGHGWGGGIWLIAIGGVTLTNNTVYGNVATQGTLPQHEGYGGGILLQGIDHPYAPMIYDVTISSNVITGNVANQNGFMGVGGGLFTYRAEDVRISQNVIQGNIAASQVASGTQWSGGGVHIGFGSTGITLTNNIIARNVSPVGGDGIGVAGDASRPASAVLWHNTIADNGATGSSAPRQVTRSPQIEPRAAAQQQAILAELSRGKILTPLMPEYTARLYAPRARAPVNGDTQGILTHGNVTLNGINIIVSGHTLGISVTHPASSTVAMNHTLWHNNTTNYSGGVTSANEHSGDPAFVNAAAGDYHITATSAARDRGANAGVAIDIDGDPRPWLGGYDIGADEYFAGTKMYLPLIMR